MCALIVLAHPEPASSTAALARTAAETLALTGWEVDRAAEGFRMDAGGHDVLEAPDAPPQVMAAQERANRSRRGLFAPNELGAS